MPLIDLPTGVAAMQIDSEIWQEAFGLNTFQTSAGGRLATRAAGTLPLWRARIELGVVAADSESARGAEVFLTAMSEPDTWARFPHRRVPLPAPFAAVTIVSGNSAGWIVSAGMDGAATRPGQWALVDGRPVVVSSWNAARREITFRPSDPVGRYGLGSRRTPCIDIPMRYDAPNGMPILRRDASFVGPYSLNLIERP